MRTNDLSDKPLCALVGFGPGNGTAIARVFASAGFRLALLSRSAGKVQSLAAAFREKATFYAADASDPAALTTAFASIRSQLGDPEVLIYNAFAFRQTLPSALSSEDLASDLAVNVTGALVATQCVLPAMQIAKRGSIIFTGGSLALDPLPQFASVGMGKAALRNLAFALAKELKPAGIHVATVTIAGFVKTGSHFDPEKIAPKFLELHQQPPGEFLTEIVYK